LLRKVPEIRLAGLFGWKKNANGLKIPPMRKKRAAGGIAARIVRLSEEIPLGNAGSPFQCIF
jgi:hypothetical protein